MIIILQFPFCGVSSCFCYLNSPRVTGNALKLKILFSKLNCTAFLHMCSMAIHGYKRPLEEKDLWSLNEDDTSKTIVQQLSKEWDREKAECKQ